MNLYRLPLVFEGFCVFLDGAAPVKWFVQTFIVLLDTPSLCSVTWFLNCNSESTYGLIQCKCFLLYENYTVVSTKLVLCCVHTVNTTCIKAYDILLCFKKWVFQWDQTKDSNDGVYSKLTQSTSKIFNNLKSMYKNITVYKTCWISNESCGDLCPKAKLPFQTSVRLFPSVSF